MIGDLHRSTTPLYLRYSCGRGVEFLHSTPSLYPTTPPDGGVPVEFQWSGVRVIVVSQLVPLVRPSLPSTCFPSASRASRGGEAK